MTKWVTKKLGDLGYSFSGLSGKTINDFGSGKPFIPYMNIFSNGKIDPNQLEYVHIEENEHQNKVEKGDWFFTTSSETPEEVGMTSVLVDDIGEAYLNSFCFGFRLYDKNEFDPEFASYLFRSKDLRKKISLFAQGSTRYNLPKQQMFEKLYITYPESLAEQRRIASILSSADGAIAASEALIEKYRNIKRGLLATLLQPKEGWKKVKLGEVYNFRYGEGNTNPNNEGPFPIYGANGIIGGYTKYNAENSIVIGHMGEYAGSVIWVDGKHFVTYNGTITTVKNENILHDRFGYFLLLSLNIKQICAGSGQPFLAYDKLNSIPISFPNSIIEQKRIASILSSIDAKIAAEEKVVEKYKGVKKGLMEELLKSNE